ncbi:putative acyltransferase [Anopheles sinensis]|uniref:Putative acyltransferase n=1 Tax=Anopheles sinensis TaxID=74873 RepID=A0A084W3T9_ANOSI|nr:putative acyltransferase [Anopheles sinensis]
MCVCASGEGFSEQRYQQFGFPKVHRVGVWEGPVFRAQDIDQGIANKCNVPLVFVEGVQTNANWCFVTICFVSLSQWRSLFSAEQPVRKHQFSPARKSRQDDPTPEQC